MSKREPSMSNPAAALWQGLKTQIAQAQTREGAKSPKQKRLEFFVFMSAVAIVLAGSLTPLGYLAVFFIPLTCLIGDKPILMRLRSLTFRLLIIAVAPFTVVMAAEYSVRSKSLEDSSAYWTLASPEITNRDIAYLAEKVKAGEMGVKITQSTRQPFDGTVWYFTNFALKPAARFVVDVPEGMDAIDLYPSYFDLRSAQIFSINPLDIESFINEYKQRYDTEDTPFTAPAVCAFSEDGAPIRVYSVINGPGVNAVDHPDLAPLVDACVEARQMIAEGRMQTFDPG